MDKQINDLSKAKPGDVVTVTNEKDIMFGFQGEVTSRSLDDVVSFVTFVYVKFHKNIVGERNDLQLVRDYYIGTVDTKSRPELGIFAYQDTSPKPSSIRLDDGYTEENKRKIGIQ